MNSSEIKLFKNLSEFENENIFYDFHNDYDCLKIILDMNNFHIVFKSEMDNKLIYFTFCEVEIIKCELRNFSEFQNISIDNIYRGRFEENGILKEINELGKSYFYIDFYENISFEILSSKIIIDEKQS